MAKIASNDPKFELEVYLDGFYWFPNFCKFSTIFGRLLAKKHQFFRWRGKNFQNFFLRKIYLVLGKCFNLPSFWYKCSLGYPPQNLFFRFLIFLVFAEILGHLWAEGGIFWRFSLIFSQNSPPWLINGPISQQKLKKSKI